MFNCNPLGVINQNLLIMLFLIQIYSQLEQKCQSEPVEDHKKDTFRQAQCDNWYKLAVKNNYTQRVNSILFYSFTILRTSVLFPELTLTK